MNELNLLCDLCNKKILNGAPYIGLNYNIESLDINPINSVPTIQVVSSEQILTMCGRCGNRKNAAVIKQVLKTTLKTKQPLFN